MGWYRIDPNTGKSLEQPSKLSQPTDFVLLNAVPGVDDDEAACYLGDGPSDIAVDTVRQLKQMLGASIQPEANDLRRLVWNQKIPAAWKLKAEQKAQLLEVIEALWDDVDGIYEDQWERPAHKSEKKWICESIVKRLTERPT